jgi:hypothetical protein
LLIVRGMKLVKCTLCPNRLLEGKICLTCGKTYCKNENVSICPFKCQGELSEFKVSEEKLNGNTLEWLTIAGSRVGLMDFDEVPSSLPAVINSLTVEIPQKYRLILFPNRKSACKIINYLRKKSGLEDVGYDKSFDKSKYTLMEDVETNKEYILLNLEATNPQHMKFLITFLATVFSKINAYRKTKHKRIIEAICKGVFDYERRLGLPFVLVDEELKERMEHLPNILPGVYAEYEATIEMMKSFPQEIPDFLRQKMELLSAKRNPDFVGWLDTLFDFVGAQIQIASILAASAEETHLNSYINRHFRDLDNENKRRLSSFSDLSRCAEIIIEDLSQKMIYSSYEAYEEKVSHTFVKALEVISPKTLRISEIDKLFEISQKYEEMIERNLPPIAPHLGTFTEFNTFLLRLFHRNTLFPETRIIVGQILQGNLVFKIWKQNDYVAYLQGLNLTKNLADLIVEKLPEIKKRFVKHAPHSTLGYHDACLALLMFAQFASMINDEENAKQLIEESKRIAERYNASSVKIVHNWWDFTKTHDYSKLLESYRSYSAIDIAEHSYLEPQAKTIMNLAKAIFKKRGFDYDFEAAEKQALSIAAPHPPKNMPFSYLEKSTLNSLVFCHLVRVFKGLMSAYLIEGSDARLPLKEAFLNADAMSTYISTKDPLFSFVYKTEAVFFLFSEDIPKTRRACSKLLEIAHDAPLLVHFVDRIEEWFKESAKLKTRRFLTVQKTEINENDPWERILAKFIAERKNEDLEKSIASAKAFVFVEGKCDVAVLEQFTMKLFPGKLIFFMDIEGYSNMSNYAQARKAMRLSIPVYMMFDGDLLKDNKKKRVVEELIKKVNIPQSRIFYLTENSIENYLLMPHAIKSAFPQSVMSEEDIAEFIKENQNKRDKKQVLNNLFCKMQIGSYKPAKAALVANKIEAIEVNQEIRAILFRTISGRVNSD